MDIEDMFGEAVKNAGASVPFFEPAIPEAKKCETQVELANWFARFARACGRARGK